MDDQDLVWMIMFHLKVRFYVTKSVYNPSEKKKLKKHYFHGILWSCHCAEEAAGFNLLEPEFYI